MAARSKATRPKRGVTAAGARVTAKTAKGAKKAAPRGPAKAAAKAKPRPAAKAPAKAKVAAKVAAGAKPGSGSHARPAAKPAARSRPERVPSAGAVRAQPAAKQSEPVVHQGHWDHADPMPGLLARVAGARERARLRSALLERRKSEFPGGDLVAGIPAELLRELEQGFPAEADGYFGEVEVARATDETGSVIGDTEAVLYARRVEGAIHYRLVVNGEEGGRVPPRKEPLPEAELRALVAPEQDDGWDLETGEIADEPEEEEEDWHHDESRDELDVSDEADRQALENGARDGGDDLHDSLLRESVRPERPRRRRD